MSGPLFFELSGSTTLIVLCALGMDQTLHSHQINVTDAVPVAGLTVFPLLLYMVCRYGENLTRKLQEVADIMYMDSNWYNLTHFQQKYVLLAVGRGQKNLHLVGYGIVDCSLEVFIKVIFIGFFLHIFHIE